MTVRDGIGGVMWVELDSSEQSISKLPLSSLPETGR